MTDSSTKTVVAPETTPVGVTTRSQERKNNEERNNTTTTTEVGEGSPNDTPRKKDKEAFKGTTTKMNGHVFQLPEEGRKANQFSLTMEALQDYANIELTHAKDLAPLFGDPCKDVTLTEPDDEPPFSKADPAVRVGRDSRAYIGWKFQCELHNERLQALGENKLHLFTVILVQCSPSVKTKLAATTGFADAKKISNCEWLITSLKNICHCFEHTEYRFSALLDAKVALLTYKQSPNQSITDYYDCFKEMLSVLESYGGQVHDNEGAAPPGSGIDGLPDDEKISFMRERCTGMLFIRNSDQRYDGLRTELANAFSKGRNEFPTTLTDAYQLLVQYKSGQKRIPTHNPKTHRNEHGRGGGRSGGRTDTTTGAQSGRGGRIGKTFAQVGLSLAQVQDHFPDGIPTNYVLLDSDSTVSIFCNPELLTDIHDVAEPLYLETNGGFQTSTQMGTIPNFGPVWYNPDSLANILSLAQVRRVRRVTMDTAYQAAFLVHRLDGTGHTVFNEHASGLYLFDAANPSDSVVTTHNPTSPSVIGYSYLQTVAANKLPFTKRQIDAADAARALYRKLGRPGPTRFLEALRNNYIINCPITPEDAIRAETIYGKDVAFLKGKTTADPAKDHVPEHPAVPLPPEILSIHPNITLCVDLFYVLGLAFSLSTSRDIHFLSCRPLTTRAKDSIKLSLQTDLSTYRDRGFCVTDIHADGEYNVFKPFFPAIRFSICSADDHVPEIERAIRTVKETVRATIHGMPYHRLPRVMVQELAAMAVRTLNMLPHPDGVSSTLSPSTIVTGLPKTDFNTLKLEFGTYVQVYDGTSNDTKSRTLGAIATNPTGNSSGDHFFMSLATGRRIHRRSWTVVPISDATISRVEAIAFEENMPAVDHDHMINEYDPDDIVDDSAYDRDYLPPSDHDSDHQLTTDAYTDTDDSDEDSTDDNGHTDAYDNAPPLPPHTLPPPIPISSALLDVPIPPPTVERTVPFEVSTAEEDDAVVDDPAEDDAVVDDPAEPAVSANDADEPTDPDDQEERTLFEEEERTNLLPSEKEERTLPKEEEERDVSPLDEKEERDDSPLDGKEERTDNATPPLPAQPITRKPGLRKKKKANYNYRFGFAQVAKSIESMPSPHTQSPLNMPAVKKAITGLMFTQMSANKGIQKHGQAAYDALRKEFEQFKAMEVLEPLDAFKMTDAQKAESLRPLSVIKEKRDGTIKGRTCADGSKQHGKYTKAETGSPTLANDALFLTVTIDAHEGRDVATADVVGAYLHAHMKDFICMRFTGWAVDLLCDVNPEYKEHVVYEKHTKVLYVRCNKAIYGCVVSGVLWYELFSQTLEKHGFVINPYDFCVANAMIEGSQCTVVWYVDDTKISHVQPHVVSNVIQILEQHFGKMTVTRGKVHEFLGMTITYPGDGTATVHMPAYITGAIADSGLAITKTAPTPCAGSLLSIDAASPLLDEPRARSFHSTVAKLIYVGTRARTDILLALGFLCSRVSAPTIQDEKKLQRLLEYLHGTVDLPLRLGADSLARFSTWVDASFAIHPDMRSHTGGVISFGRGGLICKSKKQNINTKSSTEAELIGASDYLPHTLFVKLFMAAQGYPITQATFHQDNESAIKMEQNGKASCGQRSRHIDIRYFFITDHAKRHSIDIVHCPTTDMLADFFTKPLQGSLFRKFRSVLLGDHHTDTLSGGGPHEGNAERVGYGNPDVATVEAGARLEAGTLLEGEPTRSSSSVKVGNRSHSIENYPEE